MLVLLRQRCLGVAWLFGCRINLLQLAWMRTHACSASAYTISPSLQQQQVSAGRAVVFTPKACTPRCAHPLFCCHCAETDTSWHGGCLAIAELARRSILSPDLLTQVAGLLTAALTYDVRRGPHSVGAHVRDAAAYVCWALARSYEPCQLADCVHTLSASLLVITCYDREVNCRRAAAAAFQECVGRLGSFPHGLEILAVADYYTVGNMASAYLRVAPFVAQFQEYTQVGGRCVSWMETRAEEL